MEYRIHIWMFPDEPDFHVRDYRRMEKEREVEEWFSADWGRTLHPSNAKPGQLIPIHNADPCERWRDVLRAGLAVRV